MAASNNVIVLSANPQGKFVEGIIKTGLTPKPGTILQIDASEAQVNGRDTWEIYNAAEDGGHPLGPFIVLCEDYLQGKDVDTAYAAGDRAFGYIPLAGDELNLRWADASGTVDIAIGTVGMVDDGTGLIIESAGSPETEVCLTREAYEGDTGEQLVHCVWSGY
ncbi:MAG TPA: hypothetical protein VF414_21225 [Thermoanaerobaculia bacterium]